MSIESNKKLRTTASPTNVSSSTSNSSSSNGSTRSSSSKVGLNKDFNNSNNKNILDYVNRAPNRLKVLLNGKEQNEKKEDDAEMIMWKFFNILSSTKSNHIEWKRVGSVISSVPSAIKIMKEVINKCDTASSSLSFSLPLLLPPTVSAEDESKWSNDLKKVKGIKQVREVKEAIKEVKKGALSIKKKSVSQWDKLPTVLLDIIFTHLNDVKYLLFTIEVVCKGWKTASKSGIYFSFCLYYLFLYLK